MALHLEVIPHREFTTPDELLEALDGIDTILIDVTERNHRRPQENQSQREHYSGKKTIHTQEHSDFNVGQSDSFPWVNLCWTFAGHTHDYTMLKAGFPPQEAWFEFLQVLVDLGYQGILKDYVGAEIHLPHKKTT